MGWESSGDYLRLAAYLFSFLVLLVFFKQPSHTNLQEQTAQRPEGKPEVNAWREGFLAQYKKPSGRRITQCGSDDSPCWPDGVVVQHTDLMHSTATVQTFHKPRGGREEERERERKTTRQTLVRKDGNGKQRLCGGGLSGSQCCSLREPIYPCRNAVCICGHVAPRWDLLFGVQCVVLFLLKLIFVNRSAENDWERVLENKRL